MISHIQIYENAVPATFCEHLIDLFDKNAKDIIHAPAWMDHIGMYATPAKYPGQAMSYDWKNEVKILDSILAPVIEDYRNRVDVLKNAARKRIELNGTEKTNKNSGFTSIVLPIPTAVDFWLF